MIASTGPVFFTICSKNLLGYAKTCLESAREYHPESDLYIFLADRFLGPNTGLSEYGIEVVTLEEHGGWEYKDMMFRYNITEFNTSIKPNCFLHLFQKYERGTDVIYLDPDTWLLSPLDEVVDAFDSGSNAVLIPHMLEPLGYGNLPDRELLRYGSYNFGFVALKNTDSNEELMCWWADELKDHCIIAYEQGLFVDQKYGDLFPSFIPNTTILRHNGYNIAYWNLISRTFSENSSGEILVNGDPIRFVHFSGASLHNDTDMISRHCTTLLKKHRSIYGRLLDQWSERLEANQHSLHLEQGYSFFWSNADKENEHTPEMKKANNQVVFFERNQWLYMTQYTTLDLYDAWMDKESDAIENLDKHIKSDSASHIFCNSCFSWSVASEWKEGRCSSCYASAKSRLLNAFVYQELKLLKDQTIGLRQNELATSGLSEQYYSNVNELDVSTEISLLEGGLENTVDYFLVDAALVDVEDTISDWVSCVHSPHLIIPLNDCNLKENRTVLDGLMQSLNANKRIRANLFFGMSVNHALDGRSEALLYIENINQYISPSISVATEDRKDNKDREIASTMMPLEKIKSKVA